MVDIALHANDHDILIKDQPCGSSSTPMNGYI